MTTTWDCVPCEAKTRTGAACKRVTCKYARMCYQHTKIHSGLQLRPSRIPNAGLGLFATKNFPGNGHHVAFYGGPTNIVPVDEYNRTDSGYGLKINDDEVVDATSTQSGMGRYANECLARNQRNGHCIGQNSEFTSNDDGYAFVESLNDISAGDEIFVDYGDTYNGDYN